MQRQGDCLARRGSRQGADRTSESGKVPNRVDRSQGAKCGQERVFRYASLANGVDIVRKTLGQHISKRSEETSPVGKDNGGKKRTKDHRLGFT
jgi:hypothetical protein